MRYIRDVYEVYKKCVTCSELKSCVKVEVAVPNKPTVSVDVKQHFNQPSNSQSSGAV